MDMVAFEIWLSAIVRLDTEQRGQAFPTLALAEPCDPANDLTSLAQGAAAVGLGSRSVISRHLT